MSFSREVQFLLISTIAVSVALLTVWLDASASSRATFAIAIAIVFILGILLTGAKYLGRATFTPTTFTIRHLASSTCCVLGLTGVGGALIIFAANHYGTGPYPVWISSVLGSIVGAAICCSFFAAVINGALMDRNTPEPP